MRWRGGLLESREREVAVDLYLMRHGEAKAAEEDPERPLSDEGRLTVERVAWRAAEAGVEVDAIFHSGILRARQTAEILARHLHAVDRLAARAGLEPLDPVGPIAGWIAGEAASHPQTRIALVGHLPSLGRLLSRLVVEEEEAEVVAFGAGALIKLAARPASSAGRRFTIMWALPPDLA